MKSLSETKTPSFLCDRLLLGCFSSDPNDEIVAAPSSPTETCHVINYRVNGQDISQEQAQVDNIMKRQYMQWTSNIITLSGRQTKTDTCANSVYPNKTARHEPSHYNLYCCLPLVFLFLTDTPVWSNGYGQTSMLKEPTLEINGWNGYENMYKASGRKMKQSRQRHNWSPGWLRRKRLAIMTNPLSYYACLE